MNARSFDSALRYERPVCVLIQFYREADNSITSGRDTAFRDRVKGVGSVCECVCGKGRYMELINSTG